MSDRHAQIRRLLETRFEHLPEPVRRSQASAGFVHRAPARVSCPDCLANGRPMFGCETCGGRGYTEPMRERDPYATDQVLPYGLDGSRHEQARARDRQIEVLGRQLRPASSIDELADANAQPYGWERARRRLYQEFHLAELDRAIEWLHGVLPGTSLYCGLALGFFDAVLPDPLKAPGPEPEPVSLAPRGQGVPRRALSQRDEAIRRAIKGGAPTAHVAVSFSLSVSQVNRIVSEAA